MKGWYQPEEKAMFALRGLYGSRGYLPFKMSKFEAYDLYAANKEFLVSDSVITFTDKNGRLLALKPDVTLSIVKNYTYKRGEAEKLCYSERVYRESGSTHEYKELLQCGVECIGDLDGVLVAETVLLAVESLNLLGSGGALELSHMGIARALLDEMGVDGNLRPGLLACLGAKNQHELSALCAENGIDPTPLCELIAIHGTPSAVLPRLQTLSASQGYQDALGELRMLCGILEGMKGNCLLRVDFSILQDMRYYSGIVFRGYLPGIPERVLSGGRYDPLVRQMGKSGGAIGFAVYLDLLEQSGEEQETDLDLLVLYDRDTDAAALLAFAEEKRRGGLSVLCASSVPEGLRFASVMTYGEELS